MSFPSPEPRAPNPALHVIRLRGPWELEPLARFGAPPDASLPSGGRVDVPGDCTDLLGPDFLGRVRYTRRFNRPTNLAADERVWLVFDGVQPTADAALNGHALGQFAAPPTRRFDITRLLQLQNALVIEVDTGDSASGPHGLTGEVRLEIGTP